MASSDFDGFEAAGILWKVAGGVALLLGLRALVSDRDPKLDVAPAASHYVLDNRTGLVTVPVRMTARNGTLWLHGCPRAPVLWAERDSAGVWFGSSKDNVECSGAAEGPPIRVLNRETRTTYVILRRPGKYRIAVPFGHDWSWSHSFTVDEPET